MRLLTFTHNNSEPLIGVRTQEKILNLKEAAKIAGEVGIPSSMKILLASGPEGMARVRNLNSKALNDATQFRSAWLDKTSISYLPPIVDADKFLCVGKNYRKHLEELQRTDLIKEIPQEPTSFIKLNTCLVGHEAKVVRPKGITRLDYEPELVFVMGKRALGAKKADALSYVAGVTILNDLTCRDLQLREVASGSRFWTAKNIPGFGPLGPEIVTIDEIPNVYDLWMTCSVNGEERMRVNTADQIWKISDILEHFSRFIPIEAGDMFSTGAPGGVAVGKENAEDLYLKPGDVVECAIDGISVLRTTIIE